MGIFLNNNIYSPLSFLSISSFGNPWYEKIYFWKYECNFCCVFFLLNAIFLLASKNSPFYSQMRLKTLFWVLLFRFARKSSQRVNERVQWFPWGTHFWNSIHRFLCSAVSVWTHFARDTTIACILSQVISF